MLAVPMCRRLPIPCLASALPLLVLGVLLAAPAQPAHADALCCVNPNLPLGRDEAVTPLSPGALRLRLSGGYTRHATAREGGRALRHDDDDHHHHGDHDDGASPLDGVVMDLGVAVGLWGGWSTALSVPLVYIRGEMGSLAGLGDPVVTGAWSHRIGEIDLRAAAGFSVPLGTVGAEAAVEDTTGATVATGTVDPVFSAELSRPLGTVSLLAGVDGRTPLYATGRGDRSGRQLGARVGLGLPITDVLGAGLDVQYRFRDRDQVLGEVKTDSGGHWIYAVPAIHWAFAPTWAVEARAFVPVYQYVNEIQLGHDFAVSVGISTRLGGAAAATASGGGGNGASPDGGEGTPQAEVTADDAAPGVPSLTDRQVRRLVQRGEALPALSATVPTVYDFFAEWCVPCHDLEAKLQALLAERPEGFHLRKVDVTAWDDRALQALVGQGGVLPYVRVVGPDGTLLTAGSGTPDQLLRRVMKTLPEE
jgi:thiol-disulfide isomerase/thioredoxin